MPNPLHLAAWNLNHRTGRKSIPPAVLHAIGNLDLDVLVLTEFVDGDHQVHFKDGLKDIGFESLAVSVKAPRQNQALIDRDRIMAGPRGRNLRPQAAPSTTPPSPRAAAPRPHIAQRHQ